MADLAELQMIEQAARDKVLRNSLLLSAEQLNEDPADPGWSLEMYEDQLRDASLAYSGAIIKRRAEEHREGKLSEHRRTMGQVLDDAASVEAGIERLTDERT